MIFLYQTLIKTGIRLGSDLVQNDMFYTNMIWQWSQFYPSLYQVSEPSLTFCIKTCIKLVSKLVSNSYQYEYKTTYFIQIWYEYCPSFTRVCTKIPSPVWLSVSKLVSSLYQTRIKTCIKLVSVRVQNDMFYTNMIQILSKF